MTTIQKQSELYLQYCREQRRLDLKTIKAYRIDLNQFISFLPDTDISSIIPSTLEFFISQLHSKYKPKTAKRKIASIKAFFHYLEYKEIIDINPFSKVHIKFREPFILPKTIPLHTVEKLLSIIYKQHREASTYNQHRKSLRDAAVIEMLFSTGIRISELCTLKVTDVNLYDGTILIYGKGAKERILQLGNNNVIQLLKEYKDNYSVEIQQSNYFFTNESGNALSDQSVRRMIKKYAMLAGIELHITPHMFRHTFATSLLEADVNIRYIQEMLGHSSINVTEIYTHVATAKQRDILTTKHPRQFFNVY